MYKNNYRPLICFVLLTCSLLLTPLFAHSETISQKYDKTCSAKILYEDAPDVDGNNLRDFLRLSLLLEVPYEDTYTLDVKLKTKSGLAIARASVEPKPNETNTPISAILERGSNNKLSVYFPSQAIRKIKVNGPFNVAITIVDHDNIKIGNFNLSTKNYNAVSFQPQLFTPGDINAVESDINSDGKFTKLSVQITGYSSDLGKIEIKGNLFVEENLIATASTSSKIGRGRQLLTLNFAGQDINKALANGPYRIELEFTEAAAQYSKTLWTPAFDFTGFNEE